MKFFLIFCCTFLLPLNSDAAKFDPKGTKCTFEKFITRFVQKDKSAPKLNSFFVGPEFEGDFWVYWPQQRKLLQVNWPAIECQDPSLVIRELDLTKDVVPTAEDIGTSTYLVAKSWAAEKVYLAATQGQQFTIRK